MTIFASMVGNLLVILGSPVCVFGRRQVPENKVVDIFCFWTLPNYKKRVLNSFESASEYVRVVIATSALIMEVSFHDVKYVVHYGPAKSLVDRM